MGEHRFVGAAALIAVMLFTTGCSDVLARLADSAAGEASPTATEHVAATEATSPAPKNDEDAEGEPAQTTDTVETIVQDVVGLDAETAVRALELLGLKVKLDGQGKAVWKKSNWTVVSSDPAPETILEYGSTVTLVVSKDTAAEAESRRTETDHGLDAGLAWTSCKRLGRQMYPYGFGLDGVLGAATRIEADFVYLDYPVKVGNEFGAQRSTRMECAVTGPDVAPEVTSFLVYQ